MKKNKKTYKGAIAMLAYLFLTLTDRVIVKLPDLTYIILSILIIALLLIGLYLDKKEK